MDLDDEVDGTTLAQLLNLSLRRIQQLAQDGTIPRSKSGKKGLFPVKGAYDGYIAFLQRKVDAGSRSEDLDAERARLAKEQADRIAMQNAETRRELASVEVIRLVLAQAAAKIGGILEGIPVAVKRRAPGVDQRVLRAVEDEVGNALSQVASIRMSDMDVPDIEEPVEEAAPA